MVVELRQMTVDVGNNERSIGVHQFEALRAPAKKITTPTLLLFDARRVSEEGKSEGFDGPLADIPDTQLNKLLGMSGEASSGKSPINAVWINGIFAPSAAAREDSLRYISEYQRSHSELTIDDVVASPFAITDGHEKLDPQVASNWQNFDKFVDRLHKRGVKVLLDFVPNHVALDNEWTQTHPEYLIQATEQQVQERPENFIEKVDENGEKKWFARGKEKLVDGSEVLWTDTLQLNWANPELQNEMQRILLFLLDHSDGLRVDTAVLPNPREFIRTWNEHLSEEEKENLLKNSFWSKTIPELKRNARQGGKEITFIGEVMRGDTEKDGGTQEVHEIFDGVYDIDYYNVSREVIYGQREVEGLKGLLIQRYDRAATNKGAQHVLFVENNDQARALPKYGREGSFAAAVVAAAVPGTIWMMQHGQDEGRKIALPMQAKRFFPEIPDRELQNSYAELLRIRNSRLVQEGESSLVSVSPSHEDNSSSRAIIAQKKEIPGEGGMVLCTNMDGGVSDGRITLPEGVKDVSVYDLNKATWLSKDVIDTTQNAGRFYVKLEPWHTQIVYYDF